MEQVDIVAEMVSFLPIDEMIKFRRVNTLWKQGIHSNQAFWENMYCNHFKIDQFYNDCEKDSCWLEKLLKISLKIPKKQVDGKDELFNSNYQTQVLNYQSFFAGVSNMERNNYMGTGNTLSEMEQVAFKFSKEISAIDTQDLIDHYLMVLIVDGLTVSGYTPNLLVDQIILRWKTVDSVNITIPLLSFLSYFIKRESYIPNCRKLVKQLFNSNSCSEITVGLNMVPFMEMINLEDLCESYLLHSLEDLDPDSIFYLPISEGQAIPAYFNAGGGWNDNVDLQMSVNRTDRRVVDVERSFLMEFY